MQAKLSYKQKQRIETWVVAGVLIACIVGAILFVILNWEDLNTPRPYMVCENTTTGQVCYKN